MKFFLILFLLREISGELNSTVPQGNYLGSTSTKVRNEKNVTFVDLDEKDSDELVMKWTEQAISGVIAAMANKKLKYLTTEEKSELETCSKVADSVEKHASCVLPAIHASKYRPEPSGQKLSKEENQKQPHRRRYGSAKVINFSSMKSAEKYREHEFSVNAKKILKRKQKIGSFVPGSRERRIGSFVLETHNRRKRSFASGSEEREIRSFGLGPQDRRKRSQKPRMRSLDSYSLNPGQRRLTPIGSFAKFLMASVMKEKNRTMQERVPWQKMVEKARSTGMKRRELKRKYRLKADLDPLEEMAFKALENRNLLPEDVDNVIEKLQNNPDYRAAEKKKQEKNPVKKIMGLMREGLKLGYMAAGRNTSGFDTKTVRVMSPRFLSVTPEEQSENEDEDFLEVLSPSLFSLHPNGQGLEKDLSIPNLVKSFTAADQQEWLDLIFEASGVREALKEAEKAIIEEEFQVKRKKRYAEKMRNEKGEPLYLTQETSVKALGPLQGKRNEVFDTLERSYSGSQMKEMEETGYSIMSKNQMRLLYGPGSPHANPELLKRFLALNETEIHRQIEKDIMALAEKRTVRKKRTILLSPFVGANILFAPQLVSQPIILSPVLFSNVIGSPAALGPIILGPWVFLPLILSPRVLSPAILNPFMFVPIVLSPLALHPAILCPGLFNPFVLSPLALTPFILSPQVFTPLILSPLVLSPFILTPTVGGPVILSPFVLTPVLFSPLALFALVLSPNALSPLVESKLFLAEVVLSPSWLS
ncbi:hypothetical protein FO519_002574 [Halicephalobus sp. NKZ332]|nr:hypothetical protein FO519_002574 [Halicephalobus sp. NKZ332]